MRAIRLALLGCVILLAAAPAAAVQYTVRELTGMTEACDLSDTGWAVGACHVGGLDVPCYRDGHRLRRLPLPAGATGGSAKAINNRGDILCSYVSAGGEGSYVYLANRRLAVVEMAVTTCIARGPCVGGATAYAGLAAALWQRGAVTPIGLLYPEHDYAWVKVAAVNDDGVVAGDAYFSAEMGPYRSEVFIWRDGTVVYPPTPCQHPLESHVSAMNSQGQVVGWATDAWVDLRPVVWTPPVGAMPYILYTPYEAGLAADINDAGQVVGWCCVTSSHDLGAALWLPGGAMYDLNTLLRPGSGWYLVQARAINNRGQILCQGRRTADGTYGYLLLTPGKTLRR